MCESNVNLISASMFEFNLLKFEDTIKKLNKKKVSLDHLFFKYVLCFALLFFVIFIFTGVSQLALRSVLVHD